MSFFEGMDDMTSEERIADHEARLAKLEADLAPVVRAEGLLGKVGKVIARVAKSVAKAALWVAPYLLGGFLAIAVSGGVQGCLHPVPPDPAPGPTPPNPPTPPAPIPGNGLRVLIMYDKDTLTDAQQGIVFGGDVRDYLNAKCVLGPDGKTPDRRIYAYGIDASGTAQWIRDAIQRHPGQKSWMVVSDGKTGYDGPLPANAAEAMAILKKYGG